MYPTALILSQFLFLHLEQYIELSIDGSLLVLDKNSSLDIRVSTVNVSINCKIENFYRWDKGFTPYSINQTFHFEFFSMLDGGLYICQAETLSISLDLIPTGGFL